MHQHHNGYRYFLYARKSTDTEDKQVRSIDDQLAELKEFARTQNLTIVERCIERQTAKVPGRPIFNEMLSRLERGEADGILAWHPDRLSRNSIDGGRLIYLVDQGIIRDLKFPIYSFDASSQGKFTLAIAFGQSKYYVDNLSENVKRAMRQKAKSGQFPGRAPIGYLNDPRSRTIVPDPFRGPLVRRIFELCATGEWSIRRLRDHATELRLFAHNEKPLAFSEMHRLLRNPFYYGLFRYAGELYEGQHEPLITKALFDRTQTALSTRTKPLTQPRRERLFQCVFRCGECHCAISTETQKGHNYLRCTRKKGACSQPYLREEEALRQIDGILTQVVLPQESIDSLYAQLADRKKELAVSRTRDLSALQIKIAELDAKLQRLTIAYLDNIVGMDEYRQTKALMLEAKTNLRDEINLVERHSNVWLEPLETFLGELNRAVSVILGDDFYEKRDFLRKVGSNLTIRDRMIHFDFQPLWKYVATEARQWLSSSGTPPDNAPFSREHARVIHQGLYGARDSKRWVPSVRIEPFIKDITPNRVSPHPSPLGEALHFQPSAV